MMTIVFVLVAGAGIGGPDWGDQADRGCGKQEDACHGVILVIRSDGNAFTPRTLRRSL
jgi:hypothetical protein